MTNQQPPQLAPTDPDLARYSRQVLCEQIGPEGQRRLRDARVVLFGCGALGGVLADTLVRAGVGHLRVCDRDYIELDNLQRQVLYDETDIANGLPKAQAAAARLSRINSQVTIEPHVIDVCADNIERLADGAQLLLDGTDNFETRYLINDLAVQTNRPWIYGAVVATSGLCMTVLPHDTPCLRCVFAEPPPPEFNPTCDTAGVLGPAVNLVASFQAISAIKLLVGRRDEVTRGLINIDAWTGRVVRIDTQSAYEDGDCPCCGRGEYAYLSGERGSSTTTLCGRDAVQVNSGQDQRMDLAAIADKLSPIAIEPVRHNRFMLTASVEGYRLTLFPDGRAIIKGTSDPDKARTIYARYFGA